jgi:nitrite reductase/ring-hydroxylating ferredoxin subunit
MKRLGFLAVVLIWSCMGCAKTGEVVPNVGVYYKNALAHSDLAAIKNIGGAVYIKGYGVAGIIIYHRGVDDYAAYDACSSYEPQKLCAVTIDNPSLTATDPCSGAKFSLSDGNPVKAPATRALKSYAVIANTFEIFVSN